jgi:hypothetical protein
MVPVLRNARNGRSTKTVYECYGRRQREEQGCPVSAGWPMGLVDQGVVWMLTHDVLTPELLEQALQEQSDLSARAPEQVAADRAEALAELARLDGVLANLVAFIERGEAPESILGTIKAREAERRDTKARLEHLDGVVKAATADKVTVEELREIVKDWHG